MDLYDDYGNTMEAFPGNSTDEIAPIVSKMPLNQKGSIVWENDCTNTQTDFVTLKGEQIITLPTW